MTISRRTFLSGLVSVFGNSSIADLKMRVQDMGRPLLIEPRSAKRFLHVYEAGHILLGPDRMDDGSRPTWRQYFAEEGFNAEDRHDLAVAVKNYGLTVQDLDAEVTEGPWGERCWEDTFSPMARAARLLKRLKVGTTLQKGGAVAGRLDFHDGDNHPFSSDVWVEAADDLSVSLLQARLIELREPIRVVMEAATIRKDEALPY